MSVGPVPDAMQAPRAQSGERHRITTKGLTCPLATPPAFITSSGPSVPLTRVTRRRSGASRPSTRQPELTGPALIAEIGDEAWAAVELRSGRTIADPFRPSAEIAALARASANLRLAA